MRICKKKQAGSSNISHRGGVFDMHRHLDEEIGNLRRQLIKMGDGVLESIRNAVQALLLRNSDLAGTVIKNEEQINRHEIEIDEQGHQLVALFQPMAVDLRILVMILKINTDLERMGDHAVNIAERALFLNEEPPLETNLHLREMADGAIQMASDALRAFSFGDAALARVVLKQDDRVDSYNDSLYARLADLMEKDPVIAKIGMNLFMVGHNLERIADLAVNIAENVIYMKRGEEVRHRYGGDGKPDQP